MMPTCPFVSLEGSLGTHQEGVYNGKGFALYNVVKVWVYLT
jgi:hypothetical protein